MQWWHLLLWKHVALVSKTFINVLHYYCTIKILLTVFINGFLCFALMKVKETIGRWTPTVRRCLTTATSGGKGKGGLTSTGLAAQLCPSSQRTARTSFPTPPASSAPRRPVCTDPQSPRSPSPPPRLRPRSTARVTTISYPTWTRCWRATQTQLPGVESGSTALGISEDCLKTGRAWPGWALTRPV